MKSITNQQNRRRSASTTAAHRPLRGEPAYFIPYFSHWKEHHWFEAAFAGLLNDLKAEGRADGDDSKGIASACSPVGVS